MSAFVTNRHEWYHPRADRYELVESSMLVLPDRVLTLLWWKDEKMIQDLLAE